MQVEKLASAIYNDIVGGLSGITSTPAISMDQLQDDCVEERLQIIKEYSMKNLIPRKDLMYAINCIELDCQSLDKCCNTPNFSKPELHFEIPQLVNDFGDSAIEYIGSTDKQVPFKYYTTVAFKHHGTKLRGKDKPYVYIQTTPNENNMYDGWVFNISLLKRLTIIGIFKDLRQLDNYGCCQDDLNNMTFIDTEIKKRLTEKKLRYYRSFLQSPHPNDQVPR
jgi:hypothetical protein